VATAEAVAAIGLADGLAVAAFGGDHVALEGDDALEIRRLSDGQQVERWELVQHGYHPGYPADPQLTDDGALLVVRSFSDQSPDHAVLYRFVDEGPEGEGLEEVFMVEGRPVGFADGRLAVLLRAGLVAHYPITWDRALGDACDHLGDEAPPVCVTE